MLMETFLERHSETKSVASFSWTAGEAEDLFYNVK